MPNKYWFCGGGLLALLLTWLFLPGEELPLLEEAVGDEISGSALVLSGGRLCLKESGEPYTGKVFEQTTERVRLSELPVVEGIVHGLAKGWYDSGQLEVEEHFEKGISQGVRRRWHENGQLKNEATIVNGELHGSYSEWYPEGQLAIKMTMSHGKGVGLCEAWHLDGTPKSIIVLEAGEPVTKEYFSENGSGEVVGN